jgi:exopolysaccharide biosynthesis protein
MNEKIQELEEGLKAQLASLTSEIRNAESALMTTKEGYLKVQGALEILDILKKNFIEASSEEPDIAQDVALS